MPSDLPVAAFSCAFPLAMHYKTHSRCPYRPKGEEFPVGHDRTHSSVLEDNAFGGSAENYAADGSLHPHNCINNLVTAKLANHGLTRA